MKTSCSQSPLSSQTLQSSTIGHRKSLSLASFNRTLGKIFRKDSGGQRQERRKSIAEQSVASKEEEECEVNGILDAAKVCAIQIESEIDSTLEIPDTTKLSLIIDRLEKLFCKFHVHPSLVEPLQAPYQRAIQLTWIKTKKTRATHWKFLPAIVAQPPKITDPHRKPRKLYRHDVDQRFDNKALQIHGREIAPNNPDHPLHAFSNVKISSQGQPNLYAGAQFATFPYVTVPVLDEDDFPTEKTQQVLASDPNNDGYLCMIYDGICVGGTVDGSGSGYNARLASNIALAVLYESTPLLLSSLQTSKREISEIVYTWLQNLIVMSHQKIKSTQEAGSTTASFHVLLKSENENEYVLFFVAVGDVEIHMYNYAQSEWQSLCKEPSVFDKVRIDPSVTPGGIGGEWLINPGHHGDQRKLFGVAFWDEDNGRCDDEPSPKTSVASVQSQSIKSETSSSPQLGRKLSKSGLKSKQNNLHYGQALLTSKDLLLFCTDGLGDCMDPPQVFRSPKAAQEFANLVSHPFLQDNQLATTLDEILSLPDPEDEKQIKYTVNQLESWHDFSRNTYQAALKIHSLKQTILNIILGDDDQDSLPENLQDRSSENPTPDTFVKRCISYANIATKGERDLYAEHSFARAPKWQKRHLTENARKEWIAKHPLPDLLENNLDNRQKKYRKLKYFKEYMVPFCKLDHVALQILSPKLI